MIAAGALVTLAAGDAADPNSMAAYGPWAVAFVLVLWAFKDVVLKAMGKESAPPKPQDKEAEVLRSLAVAVDKLAMVLERLERTQEKDQEELLTVLRSVEKTVEKVDMRTKDIKERLPVAGGAHGGADM
jgi:hypothetical protein